jgi:UDP-glucose 4-epimerase
VRVLAVGGAGYVGSHVVRELCARRHHVVVLDDLSTGHAQAVRAASRGAAELVQGDVGDQILVRDILRSRKIDAVMHFAAASLVGESMESPSKYWRNNVSCTVELLDAMARAGVDRIVFSSSAAVYGEPIQTPIPEDHPKSPTSTYGMTKLAIEHMLASYYSAHGIKSISLRYFNAAGADSSGDIGEDHDPETHLIPIVLKTALGLRQRLSIFGTDYPTPDGTCVRDYVHVCDLAKAHLAALEGLAGQAGALAYNLGNGAGFSVWEVLRCAERIVGRTIPAVEDQRRPGDPAVLVASSELAQRELGWKPAQASLEDIIASAWAWHSATPGGYGE